VRIAAAICVFIGCVNLSFASDAALQAALTHAASAADPHVRAAAARALADFDCAKEILVKLINDENEIVSTAAVEALAKSSDKSTIKMLVDLLKTEAARPTVTNSSPVFQNSGTLLQQFAEMKSEERTVVAIRILGRSKDAAVVPVIIAHGLQSPYIGAQIAAAIALGRLKDRAAVQPLVEILAEHYRVTPSTGNTIETGSIPANLRQIKENNAYLRSAIVWALGEIRDPVARPVLQRARDDDNSLVRDAATEALEKIE